MKFATVCKSDFAEHAATHRAALALRLTSRELHDLRVVALTDGVTPVEFVRRAILRDLARAVDPAAGRVPAVTLDEMQRLTRTTRRSGCGYGDQ